MAAFLSKAKDFRRLRKKNIENDTLKFQKARFYILQNIDIIVNMCYNSKQIYKYLSKIAAKNRNDRHKKSCSVIFPRRYRTAFYKLSVHLFFMPEARSPRKGSVCQTKESSKKMTDIHTHIVPNIDDGAESLSESFEMIRVARGCGTRTIVLTPHFPYFTREVARGDFEKHISAVSDFVGLSQKEFPDMRFLSGAEILCDRRVFDLLSQELIIPIGSGNRVLVEFSVSEKFGFMTEVLSEFFKKEFVPVLAHVERYECLQLHPERVRTLRKLGCVVCVNAESICGIGSSDEIGFSDWMLRHALVDVVASDCHGIYARSPDLSEVHLEISLRFSGDYASILTEDNPRRITENKNVLRGDFL